MKILFICGSLEPGRDGVGDYTRRLACEIQPLGHQSSIIALCDPFIEREIMTVQHADNGAVKVLRISSRAGDLFRYLRAKEWADAFDPEWISLQFVPYAFNPKGLPFALAGQLRRLLTHKRRLHIMFHEIWVGTDDGIDWMRRLTSALQQRIIHGLIKSLRPVVIHTQLPIAQCKLQKIVKNILPLPLFSNIEVCSPPATAGAALRVGFFSQAAASLPIVSFLGTLRNNAAAAGRDVELLFIGGNAEKMKETGEVFLKKGLFPDKILYTGFLPPEGISAALQGCSLGITLVPRHALGKSGSVAAFLQHGVPVAAPVVLKGKDDRDIGFFSRDLCSAILIKPELHALALAKQSAMNARCEIDVKVITRMFIENIHSVVK